MTKKLEQHPLMMALVCVLLTILAFMGSTVIAGVRDRSSDIELYGESGRNGNYISFPEITDPGGTPPSNHGRLMAIDNGGLTQPYWEDNAGTQTNLIGSAGTATDFALTDDADAGDLDIKSLATIEFYDSALIVDGSADGVLSISSDGTLALNSADWDISTTGTITNASLSADQISAGNLTIGNSYLSIGTDPADAGTIRLPNAGNLLFEASPAGTDVNALSVDSSEVIQIGSSGASGVTITPAVTMSSTLTISSLSTGAITATSGDFSDGNIANVGNINLDSIEADGSAITIGSTAGDDIAAGNSTGDIGFTSDDVSFALTDTTDDVFQLTSGATVLVDVDLGADDTITIGSGAQKFVLATSNIDISNAGAITNATGVSTSGALASSGTFDVDGNANISDTTAGANVTIGNSTGNFVVATDAGDINCTDATDNVFQISNATGPVVYFDLDLGAADALTVGNAAGTLALASSDWAIGTTGDMTNIGAISADGAVATTSTFDVDGAANISDTTAGADVAIGNSTGNVAILSDNFDVLGTDATDNVIQLGNATGPAIYFDLDLGAADALTLGNAAGTTAITSSDWAIGTTGNMTGIGNIGSNGLYTFTGSAADSDAFKVDVQDSATGQYYKVDAGPWIGVLGEGAALDFRSDSGAVGEAGHAIYVKFQGTSADAAAIDGKGLYLEDEAATTAGSYLVRLDSDDNGALHAVDGEILLENSSPLKWEGSTADAYEAELDTEDPTTDNTILLPDYSGGLPLVIAQSATQTDCTGVGTDTDITGSSLTIADGWFAATKTLKWTIVGTSDGSGGQAMTLSLNIDGADIVTLSLDTGQSDDWIAEFYVHEHTAFATQKAWGTLVNNTSAGEKFDYATDTTDFNDSGTTVVKLRGTTNHANDHIYVEYVKVETWTQ